MAKKRSKRRRGTGSIITTRRLNGVGKLNRPGSFMGSVVPPMLGGGVTGLTAVGIRHFVKPTAGATAQKLAKYAPWVGFGAGALVSAGMYLLGGTPAALSSAGTSLGVAGVMALHDAVAVAKAQEMAGGTGAILFQQQTRGLPAGRRGAGAIVPEYGTQGVGGRYGEVVNLGSINPAAFGTPGFQI